MKAYQQVPFEGWSGTTREKPIEHLSDAEICALEEKELPIRRLSQVRDVFLFQCYTGMAYADLARFEVSWIINAHGRDWIEYERQKEERALARVPVTEKARALLEKYGYKLPVLTNQKYNAYLKEIQHICGIETRLTTHVARRTCGMYLLNLGMSLETVAAVLGHKSVKTTERYYARVLKKRIFEEFERLGL